MVHGDGRARRACDAGAAKEPDDVSALISEIETDQKGIPVLLRHYLKMNGQLLSFNVDNDFGYCVDGLIIVDLTKAERRLLRSYMGPERCEKFMEFHQLDQAEAGV